MKNIEFFTFEGEVYYRDQDGVATKFTEDSREIIKPMMDKIECCYPSAEKALSREYSRFGWSVTKFEYKKALRFIRCNFGSIDNLVDIDGAEKFNFEHIPCPLRGGDCDYEGVICEPALATGLGKKQLEVLILYAKGLPKSQIAHCLGKDETTVHNQINRGFTILGIHEKTELLRFMYQAGYVKRNE